MVTSESFNPWLLGAMDSLWFHKIVLSKEPNISPKKNPLQVLTPSLSQSSSSSDSQKLSNSSFENSGFLDDDIEEFTYGVHGSLPTILTTHNQIDSDDEDDKKERVEQEDSIKELRHTRGNLSTTPMRSRMKTRLRLLERTVSCKTLAELEQEEVKGFMDLGFNFEKNRVTPRMMSVIPGLQRLQGKDEENEKSENENVKEDDEESKRKPYLSEAWLIKRPDSPLVRLRMPTRTCTTNDMKKHLKLWAKTVAYSTIQD